MLENHIILKEMLEIVVTSKSKLPNCASYISDMHGTLGLGVVGKSFLSMAGTLLGAL